MEALITLRPNSITVSEIKRKAAAFKELTGQAPEIFIQGIMFDKSGESVFFTYTAIRIEGFGRSTFMARVDSCEPEKLKIGRVDKLVFRCQ